MIQSVTYSQVTQFQTGGVASARLDSCCNDPGCNCLGGRQAKQALEAKRALEAQQLGDATTLGARGYQLLQADQAASIPPLTANSVPAIGDVDKMAATDSATARSAVSIDTYA